MVVRGLLSQTGRVECVDDGAGVDGNSALCDGAVPKLIGDVVVITSESPLGQIQSSRECV